MNQWIKYPIQYKPPRDCQPSRCTLGRIGRLSMVLLLLLLLNSFLPGLGSPQVVYAQATPATAVASATGLTAVVGAQSATLLATPGAEALQALTPGVVLTARGRTEDSQWLFVEMANGVSGWVETQTVILFGIAKLPMMPSSPASLNPEAGASPTAADESVTQPVADVASTPMTATTPISPTAIASVSVTATTAEAAQESATKQVTPILATITLTGARLNVRSGAGINYPIVAKVSNGEQYRALARNAAGDWLQIGLNNDDWGWVAVRYVDVGSPVSDLPVSNDVRAVPIQPQSATAIRSLVSSVQSVETVATTPNAQPAQPAAAAGLQGKLVFQASNGGTIYAYNLATGALWPLTHGFDPAISPDGNQVVFTRIGGEHGIYLINIDGSNEHKIFGERDQLSSPKWSPDGNWIVFSQRAGSWDCIQTNALCIPVPQNWPPGGPGGSSGGPEVTAMPNWSIARIHGNGEEYRDIAALNSAVAPDWNEAGIVYQSAAGLQKTADIPDAENRAVLQEHYVQDPDWQPGGGRIVYQSRQGSHWEIFSVNPDGTGKTALTRPVTTLVKQLPSNVAPAWSPDGQHIVFLSNRETNHEAGAWHVWVMNADGSNQHPLPIDVTLDYSYTNEQAVSWGP